MEWIEATIKTKSEEIDGLCELLAGLGIQGFSIEDSEDFRQFLDRNRKYWDYVDETLARKFEALSQIKFYVPGDADGRRLLEAVRQASGRPLAEKTVCSEDWENAWRAYYQPIEIGKRLLVVPDWLEADSGGRVPLRLEPGLAFGTGGHATTQMCLEVLDGLDLAGKSVLDLGCGSGILGIGALVLGCGRVTACDVDPLSPEAARDNAAKNHIAPEQYTVFTGDILADEGAKQRAGTNYDLVLANIVADVIIPLSAFVRDFMAEQGLFVCSGVIDSRAPEVEAALKGNGFDIVEARRKEEWMCYVCR
ncbi:MAG: 50S ribosomal protein L11 methyltransferase [Oscillospiraceae bacterium]|nr:50S ribosomal protein L11 methyltransferase [Oscillospiraceae bacterium]